MSHAARLSLPDVVSLSRLAFAAAFVAFAGASTRAVLVLAASATDFLDGWLARRRKVVTPWGPLLDPVADRVFALVALTTLLSDGSLTLGEYAILLARDIATAVGYVVARLVPWLRPVKFRARFAGKVVTTLQFVTLLAALLVPALVTPLVIAVALTATWAIVDYTLLLWNERERTPI